MEFHHSDHSFPLVRSEHEGSWQGPQNYSLWIKTYMEKHFPGRLEQLLYLSEEYKKLAKWCSLFHRLLFYYLPILITGKNRFTEQAENYGANHMY